MNFKIIISAFWHVSLCSYMDTDVSGVADVSETVSSKWSQRHIPRGRNLNVKCH